MKVEKKSYCKLLKKENSFLFHFLTCLIINMSQNDPENQANEMLDQTIKQIKNNEITELNIPDGIKELKKCQFTGYPIISVKIPDTITKLPESAFAGCTSLRKVICSKNLTYIGNSAFFQCNELVEFEIPDSVIKIDLAKYPKKKKIFLAESVK